MATARNGLCSTMVAYPESTFDSLTDLELDYVGTLAKCSFSLNSFIEVIHDDPDNLLFCGSCLTHSGTLVTEHDWQSILHQCSRNVVDARDHLIASATSSIESEVQEWDAFQRHTLKEAIITSITSLTPPTHLRDLGLDPRLDAWFVRACESMMADGILRAQADADAHRDIVFADLCAKAESEAKMLAQAHFDQTLARLRNEAELAAHDAVKSTASAPPIGKSASSSGHAGRKAKASPVVSRPSSRATVHSPTPLPLPPNIPKATTVRMGLDQASPILPTSPSSHHVAMTTDDTTPTGSPVVRPALVERYASVVPDSQETHAPSPVPGSHAAVPYTICDTSLLDRTAPHGGGIDRSAPASAEVAMVVAPWVEGANTAPPSSHTPAPSSDLAQILAAITRISAKVEGVDLRVSALTSRVSTIEQGRMPSTYDYTGLDDGSGPLPDFDYFNMPVDLEESIARLEDEATREQDEEDHAIDLLYDNIVHGTLYGDHKANVTDPHPDASLDYFARVAYAWASERKLSLAVLDHAGRMDLSKHF